MLLIRLKSALARLLATIKWNFFLFPKHFMACDMFLWQKNKNKENAK